MSFIMRLLRKGHIFMAILACIAGVASAQDPGSAIRIDIKGTRAGRTRFRVEASISSRETTIIYSRVDSNAHGRLADGEVAALLEMQQKRKQPADSASIRDLLQRIDSIQLRTSTAARDTIRFANSEQPALVHQLTSYAFVQDTILPCQSIILDGHFVDLRIRQGAIDRFVTAQSPGVNKCFPRMRQLLYTLFELQRAKGKLIFRKEDSLGY